MADDGFVAFLKDELAPLGTIRVRKMFGGATLYCDGAVFALIVEDTLYLKADASLSPRFVAEGCPQFTYETKDGRHASMSYWRAPEYLVDDVEALRDWCRASVELSRRIEAEKAARPARKRDKA
jgi:DNA transformation protein